MLVARIYVDNPYVVLYQNKVGLVYRALNLHEKYYLHDITLHVYGKKDSTKIQILDDWNNAYHLVKEEKLVGYTLQGTHIFNQGKYPPTEPLKPMPSMDFFLARPWEADYNTFTSRYMEPLHTSFADRHMHSPRPMGDGYY